MLHLGDGGLHGLLIIGEQDDDRDDVGEPDIKVYPEDYAAASLELEILLFQLDLRLWLIVGEFQKYLHDAHHPTLPHTYQL